MVNGVSSGSSSHAATSRPTLSKIFLLDSPSFLSRGDRPYNKSSRGHDDTLHDLDRVAPLLLDDDDGSRLQSIYNNHSRSSDLVSPDRVVYTLNAHVWIHDFLARM